ncbi:MAG: disulfide bond formation protein B [Pelistega sp.]|nr:disulfide bond formation protein B [Pelistega sp.]
MNTQRILNLIALFCLAAVGFALFSQHVLDMQPCAWCVFQRFIFLVIAGVCLLANLFRSGFMQKFFAFSSFALSIGGALAAWYQYSVAANMFSCDMTFADQFMAKWTGLDGMVPWLFGIYASCMDAKVDLLGIEYALWGLGLFVLFAVLSLVALFKREPRELFS